MPHHHIQPGNGRQPGIEQRYPRREPFFAMKFIRRMAKACIATTLGHRVFTLLTVIASVEDTKRYTAPVAFFNEPLMQVCGFQKWKTLDAARRVAVAAGWLVYVPPSSGSSRPGYYWVAIPPEYADLSDSPLGEPTSVTCDEHMPSLDNSDRGAYAAKGYAEGYAGGYAEGDAGGQHSYPIPNPFPIPTKQTSDIRPPSRASRPKKVPKWTEADRELAIHIWSCVQQAFPETKPPDLGRWADDIRLAREQDNRDLARLREIFDWAHSDHFWRPNVRSPGKLREKFETLTAQKERPSNGTTNRKPLRTDSGVVFDPNAKHVNDW